MDEAFSNANLHSFKLEVMTDTFCETETTVTANLQTPFGRTTLADMKSFCAGSMKRFPIVGLFDSVEGLCDGDKGGSLVCIEEGVPVLYGVATKTHLKDGACGAQLDPGIYAKVSEHMAWITSTIGYFSLLF